MLLARARASSLRRKQGGIGLRLSSILSFFLDTFLQHWTYLTESSKNKVAWLGLLAEHPDLSSFLLSALAGRDGGRKEALDTKPLAAYL